LWRILPRRLCVTGDARARPACRAMNANCAVIPCSRCRAPRNDGTLAPHLIRPALLQCALIGRARMDAVEKRHRLRMALIEPPTRGGCLERKTHLDVGCGEFIAGEPFALGKL